MEPQAKTEMHDGLDPAFIRKIKVALIAIGIVGVFVLAYFIVREIREANIGERWDEFARIQDTYALGANAQDPLFEGGPDTPYFERRANYIAALETFLPQAESADDALAPQVHWLIAKLSADQVISLKDELDVEKRAVLWEKARENMQVIVDRYPDFQTNWTMFAPAGHSNLTRAFLATVAANVGWEREYLPKSKAPASDPVVVIRTERGDLHMGLYRDDAKALTDLFVERAVRGDYDGTAFFAKSERMRGGATLNVSLRGGHPATREATLFDREASAPFAETEHGDLLPADSRHLVPADRGVVLAWHDPASVYDGPQTFVVAQQRSPLLDYDYSPIGKLLDDASLATLDRLFEGDAWRDDVLAITPPDEAPEVAGFLQAPVRIVKVLVFEGGKLVEPGTPAATKADVGQDERTLDGLIPDGYKAEAPQRPAPEKPEVPETPDEPAMPEEPEMPEMPEEPTDPVSPNED